MASIRHPASLRVQSTLPSLVSSPSPFHTTSHLFSSDSDKPKRVEDVMLIATGHECEELEAELQCIMSHLRSLFKLLEIPVSAVGIAVTSHVLARYFPIPEPKPHCSRCCPGPSSISRPTCSCASALPPSGDPCPSMLPPSGDLVSAPSYISRPTCGSPSMLSPSGTPVSAPSSISGPSSGCPTALPPSGDPCPSMLPSSGTPVSAPSSISGPSGCPSALAPSGDPCPSMLPSPGTPVSAPSSISGPTYGYPSVLPPSGTPVSGSLTDDIAGQK